jgi:uncharacterized membrane protein
MTDFLAQNPQNLGTFNGIGGISNVDPATSPAAFTKVMSTALGILTVIAGLFFLFRLITAAFKWIGAGGNKDSLSSAQKQITSSLIGLVIVVLSYALVGLIGSILGLNILNLTPLINSLAP